MVEGRQLQMDRLAGLVSPRRMGQRHQHASTTDRWLTSCWVPLGPRSALVSAHSAHAATPGRQRGRVSRVAGFMVMVLGACMRSGFWSLAWLVLVSVAAVRLGSVTDAGTTASLAAASASSSTYARKERNGLLPRTDGTGS